ncbi:MAG: SGNH/GDSL hydrolase family protein [Microscillaceae bacterium]|nr:SGNH/GDSL hydrolase family protein [Microscillaceae bacterium]MDW8461338.1 SGNH/GDSL hydrolase family protein [Cytophagales bacterium]
MINKRLHFILTVLLGLSTLMVACKKEESAPAPSKGNADFTKYVAVGNSLTAGFADNGLYREGQLNSYPALLAQQFKLVGGGDFIQPLFSEAQANGTGYLVLTGLPTPQSPTPRTAIIPPQAIRGLNSMNSPLFTKFTGPNQNLGVPGIRMENVQQPGYGSQLGNPYFERLLPDDQPLKTYLQYVAENIQGATFFSCWIGNNDALGYATSGGLVPMTSDATFEANCKALLNVLANPDAEGKARRQGIVVSIPSVTSAAFFNTVSVNTILSQVNAALRAQNPCAAPVRQLFIQTASGVRASSPNALPLAPNPACNLLGFPATADTGDLYFLGSLAEYARIGSTTYGAGQPFPYGLDPNNPLTTQHVLDRAEVAAVNSQIVRYNTILRREAERMGLAFYDVNETLNLIRNNQANGYRVNGVPFRLDFVSGGVFSLDGIHLTQAANAVIANEIIERINKHYGSTIPKLDVSRFKRVTLVNP